MGDKNRGTSPYDDDYSDDFDDDASDVGNRRYKTRSPLTRTVVTIGKDGQRRPSGVALGGNTYRKARGGMSLASGYLTPTSQKTADFDDEDDEDDDTLVAMSPRSKIGQIEGGGVEEVAG
ncbi:hypothetical protein MAR_018444 [Mya arenaria]|uniref:Uncharacterized protein n=1 Tax=Mya arenaria TaxID=6604 RepID=A0ABY7EMS3_MYAAR|nr:hypothetical protein MAR_018444 [Mya arenaria]